MNKGSKLIILYVLFFPWFKAGLATGYGLLFFLGIAAIIALFWFKDNFKYHLLNRYIIHTSFLLIILFSHLNPRFRNLTQQDLIKLDYNNILVNSGNINKSKSIADNLSLIIETGKVNKSESLAIFFDFKNKYRDKYGNNDEDIGFKFLSDCEKLISLDFIKFFPSVSIFDKKILTKHVFFIFHIYFFIFISYYFQTRKLSKLLLFSIFINTSLLALIGCFQKYFHQNTDQYIEILGIWNAPEPRYYFSTFTYKNHWSCFAIVSLFIGIYIAYKTVIKSITSLDRNPEFILILILNLLILSTIFLSGSRSGILLCAIGLISIIVIYFFNSGINFIKRIIYIILISSLLVTLFTTYIIKSDQAKEMKINSLSQFQNFRDGNFPLRFHLWKDALTQIRDKPWLGSGFGAYASTGLQYQSSIVRDERNKVLENAHSNYIPLVAHAHNDVLEFLIEFGLFGCFLLFFPMFPPLSKIIFSKKTFSLAILLTGFSIVLLYHALDFPSRTPATLLSVSVLFAICYMTPSPSTKL
jgi:O-antigen ligase